MIMSRRDVSLALGAAAAIGLTVFAMLASPAKANAPTIGQPAPAFQLTDSNGATHSLNDFRGKTVVLEWSNHDCPYVIKHYGSGNMQGLQREAAADGVVWLTIVSSAPGKQGHVDGAKANALTQSRNAAPTAVLLDPNGAVGRAYDARTTPHMYIINTQGVLVYQGGIDNKPTANPADLASATNYVRAALADVEAGRPVATPVSQPYGCSVKY